MLSIKAIDKKKTEGKIRRCTEEGITEMMKSGNDIGDKTADHSTL